MNTLRFRLSGAADLTDQLVHVLEALEGVERCDVIDDLMPHLDDDDSSSAGLAENSGDQVVQLEIEVEGDPETEHVQRIAEEGARRAGLALERVDEF